MFFSSSQKMSWWTTEVGVLKKLVKMKQKKKNVWTTEVAALVLVDA